MTYPGVLANCAQCHLPNTYNFGATASADAAGISDGIDKRLLRTVATGKYIGVAGNAIYGYTYNAVTLACDQNAALGSAQTALGVFSLPPSEYGLLADANGASGTYYGYGFSFNAAAAGAGSPSCSANGTVIPAVPGQGTLQAVV